MKFFEIQQLYSLHRHTASNLIWSGHFWKVLFGRSPCSKCSSLFYYCSFLGRGSFQNSHMGTRVVQGQKGSTVLLQKQVSGHQDSQTGAEGWRQTPGEKSNQSSRRVRTQFNSWLKKYSHLLACVALYLRRCNRRHNHYIHLQTIRI